LGSYNHLENVAAFDLLRWVIETYEERFAIATGFQKGGMILLDLAWRTGLPFRVFTLDTGRLPKETASMLETVRQRYGIGVEVVTPDPAETCSMVQEHGLDLFYDSPEMRRTCCDIRKVRPFDRKLQEFDAWATGLRRGHGRTLEAVPKVSEEAGRLKLAPVADWSPQQVEAYLSEHDVPVHPLYAQGYTSIGCRPCTRAIMQDEDERAGRWTGSAKTECGLHTSSD